MEPEKFENKIKHLLEQREVTPAAQSWERLEQRLEKNRRAKKPIFLWLASAAAIAVVFFVLGSLFNNSIIEETPQLSEEQVEHKVLENNGSEPEVLQPLASEEKVKEKKSSAERGVKNDIFETPSRNAAEEQGQLAVRTSSEEPEADEPKENSLLAESSSPVSESFRTAEVSDTEVEALLLLASAELQADSVYTVNSRDLLQQVEYELEQSFRQKIFEVVKDGFSKAKTAVANRDF